MNEIVVAILCFLAGWLIKLAKEVGRNSKWLNDLTHRVDRFETNVAHRFEKIEKEFRSEIKELRDEIRKMLLGR